MISPDLGLSRPRSPLKKHPHSFALPYLKKSKLKTCISLGYSPTDSGEEPYLLHYHEERNHQGLENRIIKPGEKVGRREGVIECQERPGGMLRYYYRDAA